MLHQEAAPDEINALKLYGEELSQKLRFCREQIRVLEIAEEEKASAAKLVEQTRLEDAKQIVLPEQNVEQEGKERRRADRSRITNARGNNCDHSLKYSLHFPSSMVDVRCVAIGNGGYIAIRDSGCSSFHGIPKTIADVVKQQRNSHLKYGQTLFHQTIAITTAITIII